LKRSTLKFLVLAAVISTALLILIASVLPRETPPSLPLSISLFILMVILAGDLSRRATTPSKRPARTPSRRIPGRDVQYLTRQVAVSVGASSDYFRIVLNRLREALVEKISLETGMDKQDVKRILTDSREAGTVLRDPELLRLLYTEVPKKGNERLTMLREVVDRIEAWKA
jgi:hypothetical protein